MNKTILVIGLIILFVGATVVPNISAYNNQDPVKTGFEDYVRFDDFEDYDVGEIPKVERGWTTSGLTENQFIEARKDPLDPSNMVMLINGSEENSDIWCILHQKDFGPADEYIIQYRIYSPQLSRNCTIYEHFKEDNTPLVIIHRDGPRKGIRWGSDSTCGDYYDFDPSIGEPSTTRWIEESVTVTRDYLRLFHDNSICAYGGFCNAPVKGVSSWSITGYRERSQDFYIDDFQITEYTGENQPPTKPTISGPTIGKTETPLEFTFQSADPDCNDLFYFIDWGDGDSTNNVGPYASGEEATFSHTWSEEGTYTITASVKDLYGLESPQNQISLTISKKSRAVTNPVLLNLLEKLIDQFPLLQRLLTL